MEIKNQDFKKWKNCGLKEDSQGSVRPSASLRYYYLPWWHVIRRFLQLDHLLVLEMAPVMHHSKRMVCITVRAQGGLGDTASLDLDCGLKFADGAAEKSVRHLRNQIGGSNHHAGNGDELVNVLRIEAAHVPRLVGVVGADLNLVAEDGVGIFFEKHFVHGHVHGRNHFLRVATELPVQVLVKQFQMASIDIHVGLL